MWILLGFMRQNW
jgi:serine/threonine protein kinase